MRKTGTVGMVIERPSYTPHSHESQFPVDRAERLSAALVEAFGNHRGSLKEAAHVIDINYTNLIKMVRQKRAIPDWIFDRLTSIRAGKAIPLPDPDSSTAEQDGIEAVSPLLDELFMRAGRAGWTSGKISLSVLNWAIKRLEGDVGREATIQIIEMALKNYATKNDDS